MTLTNLLRDTDPLRHEPPFPDVDRERIRQAVLRTQPAGGAIKTPRLGWRLRIGMMAIGAIGAVALGYLLWAQGTTAVLAAIRFEVRLAEAQPVPGLVVAQIADSDDLIYLHPEIVVSNDDIAQSSVVNDGSGRFAVAVKFRLAGAKRMRQATEAHLNRPVAILIDGRVVMAPVIRSPIGESAMIVGDYTRAQAETIAEGIGTR